MKKEPTTGDMVYIIPNKLHKSFRNLFNNNKPYRIVRELEVAESHGEIEQMWEICMDEEQDARLIFAKDAVSLQPSKEACKDMTLPICNEFDCIYNTGKGGCNHKDGANCGTMNVNYYKTTTDEPICPKCNGEMKPLANKDKCRNCGYEISINETLEEVSEQSWSKFTQSLKMNELRNLPPKQLFIEGYKHCEKTMYSEEQLQSEICRNNAQTIENCKKTMYSEQEVLNIIKTVAIEFFQYEPQESYIGNEWEDILADVNLKVAFLKYKQSFFHNYIFLPL